MRKIMPILKAVCILFGVLAACGFLLLVVFSPRFERGEGYELYRGTSSSSPIVQTASPFLDKLRMGGAAGESVRYEGDRAEELAASFRARLVFSEEQGGVKNYYLFSPFLGEGVELCGKRVNLHIAVRENRTAAGTPLIFGGF